MKQFAFTIKNIAVRASQLFSFFYFLTISSLAGAADVPALERLNLGYSTAGSVATAPLWITQDIGGFKKYSFDVRPIYLAGGLAPVALMAGEIQVAIMSAGVLIPPALKGADLITESFEIVEVAAAPVSKELKKRWSYFIRKVYETDPLICPKCHGEMRIISLCEAFDYVK